MSAGRRPPATPAGVPADDDTEAPRPSDTEAPRPSDTEAPRPDDTEAPRPSDTEAPRPSDTEAPRPDDTEAPRPDRGQLLRLGAAAGAVTMAATSTGDLLVVAVLLGLVAGDVVIGAVGVVAALATLARWSSSSLTAVAGGQAVLGAAGWTGPAALVVSSWAAAAGVILVSPQARPAALAFGLVAAGIVAGPALGDGSVADVVLRLAASVAGVAAAWVGARAVPRRQAHLLALALVLFALLLVVAPASTTR